MCSTLNKPNKMNNKTPVLSKKQRNILKNNSKIMKDISIVNKIEYP